MEAYLLKGSEEVINSVHNDCIIVQIRVEPYHPSRETNSTCDNIILVILLRLKKNKKQFLQKMAISPLTAGQHCTYLPLSPIYPEQTIVGESPLLLNDSFSALPVSTTIFKIDNFRPKPKDDQ